MQLETDRDGNVTVLRWSLAHPSLSPSFPLLLIPHLPFPSLSHFCSHGLISHTHLAPIQWCWPLPLLIVIHIENHPSITLLSLIPPSLLSWSHTMNASIHIRRLYHHLLMSFVCKIPISLVHFTIWHSHMVSIEKMGISAVRLHCHHIWFWPRERVRESANLVYHRCYLSIFQCFIYRVQKIYIVHISVFTTRILSKCRFLATKCCKVKK